MYVEPEVAALSVVPPGWFIESAAVVLVPDPVVLPVEFMLLVVELGVPLEFIVLGVVPDVVAAPVALLVPVVLALLVVASAA